MSDTDRNKNTDMETVTRYSQGLSEKDHFLQVTKAAQKTFKKRQSIREEKNLQCKIDRMLAPHTMVIVMAIKKTAVEMMGEHEQ